MIPARQQDKESILELLTNTFAENRSVLYLLKKRGKNKRIRQLMAYAFDICFLFGKVYLSDDRTACALILFPDKKHFSLKSLLLDLRLIFTCIGLFHLRKALRREAVIRKMQAAPVTEVYYLWFIGVNPARQHQGIGGKLLDEIVQDSYRMNRKIYLETSTASNISWYIHHGLEQYAEFNFGYSLYFFKYRNG
jgi:ribosomal protein S18 acetylase RimI-like enzyme